jgi:hypothetical protein
MLDTHDEHNPKHPANIKEIEREPHTELEEQQEWNQELLSKIEKYKKGITECIEILEQPNEDNRNYLVINKLKAL